jgi:PleD family two-component response regulator
VTPGDPFLEEDFRVLTPEAFDFVLNNELKRAVRSQNFLTLLLLEPTSQAAARPPADADAPPTPDTVRQVARLVSREVRETDLLAETENGRVSVVLLDADLQNSMRVVDRLMSRFEHYEFPTPLAIEVGAACCPTHGVDVESLRRVAEQSAARPRRDNRGNASNQ